MREIQKHVDKILNFLIESTPTENIPHVDAIFVFGNYEPRIAQHAAYLWKKQKADKIVITGKGRNTIPEGFDNEADYYAQLIKSEGVPEENLILEKEATNSLENVIFGIKACHKAKFYPNSLILCAIPPLLRRSRATFRKQFPEITVYGSSFQMPPFNEWETKPRLKRMLAEFDRFKIYSEKGDILLIKVPENVLQAIRELKTKT